MNFQNINQYFSAYKKSASKKSLNSLYTELDPLVVDVTNNIAKFFRHRYKEDFQDIQQNVRITVFTKLDNICQISMTGEQLAKILVRVIIYSFIDEYNKYKKTRYYEKTNPFMTNDELRPNPTTIPIEVVTGGAGTTSTGSSSRGYIDTNRLIYTKAAQEDGYYINTLNKNITKKVIGYNRFKENEKIVLFCLESLLNSRGISPKILAKNWKVSNPSFWIRYTEVLAKISIYEVVSLS